MQEVKAVPVPRQGMHAWALTHLRSALRAVAQLRAVRMPGQAGTQLTRGQHRSLWQPQGFVPVRKGTARGLLCATGHLLNVPLCTSHVTSGPQCHLLIESDSRIVNDNETSRERP